MTSETISIWRLRFLDERSSHPQGTGSGVRIFLNTFVIQFYSIRREGRRDCSPVIRSLHSWHTVCALLMKRVQKETKLKLLQRRWQRYLLFRSLAFSLSFSLLESNLISFPISYAGNLCAPGSRDFILQWCGPICIGRIKRHRSKTTLITLKWL